MERGSDQGQDPRLDRKVTADKARRVLLIDYDEDLAAVLKELLESNGVEVVLHNCPPDACLCGTAVLATHPDAVVVNVAEPMGGHDNLHGWQCLQNVVGLAVQLRIKVIGYTIFDSYTLGELVIDANRLGVRILANVNNPADFADLVAAGLTDRQMA